MWHKVTNAVYSMFSIDCPVLWEQVHGCSLLHNWIKVVGGENVMKCFHNVGDVTSPTSQLIPQPFPRFTYVTTHSPTLPFLHLRHSSFSNPSFASPTSQSLHLIHLASRPCIQLLWIPQAKIEICVFVFLTNWQVCLMPFCIDFVSLTSKCKWESQVL